MNRRLKNTLNGAAALLSALLIFALILAAFVGAASFEYSDGFRTGVVTKISEKGILFTTVEGQLAVGGTDRSETWTFTDRGGENLLALREAARSGRTVRLYYKEYYTSLPWLGDTTYDITEVK